MVPDSVYVRGLWVTVEAKSGVNYYPDIQGYNEQDKRSLLIESARGIGCTLLRVGGVFAESESSMTDGYGPSCRG